MHLILASALGKHQRAPGMQRRCLAQDVTERHGMGIEHGECAT